MGQSPRKYDMAITQNDGSEVVVSIHEDFWISAQDEKKFNTELENLIAKYKI